MEQNRITFKAKRHRRCWVVVADALTFHERNAEDLGEAVRDFMRIHSFRIEFDNGTWRDYDYEVRNDL